MQESEYSERYSNAVARVLFSSIFRDQWIIPEAPKHLELFFRWYEGHRMSVDYGAIMIDRPIFFLSMPRCGSSMLQDVMSANPGIAYITNMMHLFRRCFCAAEHFRHRLRLDVEGERFIGDSVRVSGGSPADPVGTWADWLSLDPYSLECTEPRASDLSTDQRHRIMDDIRKVLWCFRETAAGRFMCKTPALLPHMRLLNDLFPDAKFLHLVRDARMSANSLVKLYQRTNDQLTAIRRRSRNKGVREDTRPFVPYPRLPNLAEYVKDYGADDIRTAANLWSDGVNYFGARKSELRHYLEIRYEDVVKHPRAEIARIFDFCELPEAEQCPDRFWEKLNEVGRIHHKNTYGNFALIEDICGAEMARYGYL